MSNVGSYNFTSTENFVIENSILKGIEVPSPIRHSNYGELILETMKTQPGFVGQIDGSTGRKDTFADMTEKSVRCAIWLKQQNIQPGEVIAICTHNQPDMYVPCFASLYVGAICNAWWDVGLTKELATHFLTLTKPTVLFVNEISASIALEAIENNGGGTKVIVFGKAPDQQSLDDILAMQDSKLVPEFRCLKLENLDHPGVIMYTSGSTGLPKGVLHSHRALMKNCFRFGDVHGKRESETTLLFSPLSWLSGLYVMFRGAVLPDTRVISSEFTEETAFQLIEKFKVTWMFVGISTAFRLQKSAAKANYDLSSLKSIFIGGAAFKEDRQKALADAFPHVAICQAYGSTELGSAGLQQGVNFKVGSCGIIVENMNLKIVDTESGKVLGPNQPGEGCFRCPSMMTCYYRSPEATREVIDADGWLHTGDLMQYDEEGHVFYVDRMKELIKYRGNHVSPGMIEQVLQTHPQVLEAAVVAIPHDIDDEHAIAFVATVPNSNVTEDELKKMVSDTLPDYMRLRGGLKILTELPHTSSGKVARSDLRKLAKNYASS